MKLLPMFLDFTSTLALSQCGFWMMTVSVTEGYTVLLFLDTVITDNIATQHRLGVAKCW